MAKGRTTEPGDVLYARLESPIMKKVIFLCDAARVSRKDLTEIAFLELFKNPIYSEHLKNYKEANHGERNSKKTGKRT